MDMACVWQSKAESFEIETQICRCLLSVPVPRCHRYSRNPNSKPSRLQLTPELTVLTDYLDLAPAAASLGDIRQARVEAVKKEGLDNQKEDLECAISRQMNDGF